MPGRFPPSAWKLVAVLAALALPAPASADAAPCPSGPATEFGVLCELNAVRTANGRTPLQARPSLRTAAQRHAADMVASGYFGHVSPQGEGPAGRARRAGYMDAADRWRIGEVLIWWRGAELTAAAAVRAWLGSPGHRRVILTAAYRDAGVGIAPGAPLGDPARGPAATIAVLTGRRR